MKFQPCVGVVASLLLAGSALASDLQVLSDKGSARMFGIRVSAPAALQASGVGRVAPPTAAALRATADAFIAANRELIGIGDPTADLVVTAATTDQLGLSRVKYFQRHHGLDVLGGEVAVHLDRDGQVTYIKTKVASELPEVVTPSVSEATARDVALAIAGKDAGDAGAALAVVSARLLVVPLGIIRNQPSEASHLAWEVEVADADTGGEKFGEAYYVDARAGEVVLQLTRVLRHDSVAREVLDSGGPPNGHTVVLDMENPNFLGYFHGRSEGMPSRGPYPDPVSPFYGSLDVDSLYSKLAGLHEYYSTTYSINGPNGTGGLADWGAGERVIPRERLTRGLVHNDGSGFQPTCPWGAQYSVTSGTIFFCDAILVDDTIAHEYTHGVVHHSFLAGDGNPIGPVYSGQCASLNEAYADFMGEVFEAHYAGSTDWKNGTGSGVFFRNLADPHASVRWDGDSLPYPDRFYDATFYCGSVDNFGAHRNMTVPAHAFYLIAEGGAHNSCSIQAQGMDVAQQIYFRGWRSYFSSTVSFNEAHADLIQACNDLYPSSVCAEVTKALQSVEMDQPGACSGLPASPPPCAVLAVDDGTLPTSAGVRLLGRNPSAGSVHFAYRTAVDGRVEARIHDVAGRVLARPVHAHQVAGEQHGVWDGRLENGGRAAAGVYHLSVTLDGVSLGGRKLVFVR